MINRKGLSLKIMIPAGIIVIATIAIILGMIASRMYNISQKDAVELSKELSYRYGYLINKNITEAMDVSRSMAKIFEASQDYKNEINRDFFDAQLNRLLKSNDLFYGIWAAFEPNQFDGRDSEFINHNDSHDDTGIYYPYFYKENGNIMSATCNNYGTGDYYQNVKKSQIEEIINPYVETEVDPPVMMTSVAAPIMSKGQFIGAVGIDLILDDLTAVAATVKPYETGYGFLIANDGTLVTHPNHELLGKNLAQYLPSDERETIINAISQGRLYQAERKSLVDDQIYFMTFAPVTIGRTASPWSFCVAIPKSKVLSEAYNALILALVLTILGVLFLNAAIFYLLHRVIIKPVNQVSTGLENIAQGDGDLTMRLPIHSQDEIGKLSGWFNNFVANLDNIISSIKATATQVNAATDEVSSGSQGLSQATQEQASAIEEVAATIEEMTSAIKQNAENATHGSNQSREMVDLAKEGGDISGQLVNAMNDISEASKKVSAITTTVNDVAFQTNLLALNAAVEAARAGEHGKGFAVVAEEVRNLAQRSAEASKEIQNLIEDTIRKVNAGDAMVQKSRESLQNIISRIEVISQTMDEIAASSAEQANGVDELNRAATQIDSSIQRNASTVEELASVSDSLSIEANGLAENVSRFNVSKDRTASKERQLKPKISSPTVSAPPPSSDSDDFEEF